MALTNLQVVSIYNANDEYIDMYQPLSPDQDTAYFIPRDNSWDGLATVSVADDVFDTDNTDYRSQLGKIQFAPRIFTIGGTIRVLKRSANATEDTLYQARSDMLRAMQRFFAAKDGGLRLQFTHKMDLSTAYTLYCHLHGADAFRVIKTPEYYDITISLIAEDPLIYQNTKAVTVGTSGVTNTGDVPEFAKIEIQVPEGKSISQYSCSQFRGSEEITKIVTFRSTVTGTVTIDVDYPHQICSIDGTPISNIDVSDGKPAFLKLPRGTSYWHTGTVPSTIKITYRQPLLGIPP